MDHSMKLLALPPHTQYIAYMDSEHKLPDATLLFRLLSVAAMRLRTRMDERLAEVGLTTQQATVLTLVKGAAEAPTQADLARVMGTSHQNVRQLLDALQRKGLVEAEWDAKDRRARRVRCTAAVDALFVDRDAGDHAAIRDWFGALSDEEVVGMTEMLRRVLEGL